MSPATHRPAIYVLDPYHVDAVDALKKAKGIQVVLPNHPEKANYIENANVILLRSETHITSEVVAKCCRLQCIVKQGVGVDNVDLEACRKAGIKVFNTPGLNTESVAELALALTLSLARRVTEIDRRTRQGESIVRSKTLGKSLHGTKLGVIGMGAIGYALAKKWIGAMEGSVIGYDPYSDGKAWANVPTHQFEQVDSLESLLKVSDVVSLHVPLTKETRDLISDDQFDLMKDNSILINCARGAIVNEDALLRALQSGKLFGVGLDAMQVEPPTLKAYKPFMEASANLIMTPHVGASTVENQSKSGLAAVEIALGFLQGHENGHRVA